jgi:hypothetical protein
MKKALFVFLPVLLIVGFFALPVVGADTLVKFEGGIGVGHENPNQLKCLTADSSQKPHRLYRAPLPPPWHPAFRLSC